ncbi:recombinase family protein [Parasediminibacterium paludis]|uniref:recombinase family protein n=1 Tax=Parasediminibacterium paludis TaxID=908966 RepID=UPI00367285B5
MRYLRISTDKQSHFSIKGQDMRTLEWCQRNNVTIIDTFIDNGESARTLDRPDFNKLLAFIKKYHKQVDYLVVQEFDRFSRNAGEAMVMIKDLQKTYKIQVVGVNEGITFDYNTPGSLFRTGLQLLLAEDDNIRRAGKINAGIYTAKVRDGRYIGAAPFGYTKQRNANNVPIMVINPPQAAIVRYIFNAFLADTPMQVIAQTAFKMGMPQRSHSIIRKMLTRHAYTGLLTVNAYQNNPAKIVEAAHEPIISRTQWLEVQAKLSKGTVKQLLNENFPLRGVLKCHCGKAVTGAASSGKYGRKFNYYKCHGPKHLNLSATKAHDQLQQVFTYLSIPKRLITAIVSKVEIDLKATEQEAIVQQKQLKKDLEKCLQQITSVEEKFINNQLNSDSYNRWQKELTNQRLAITAQLEALTNQQTHLFNTVKDELMSLSNLNSIYNQANLQQKQQFIKLVFDSRLYYSNNTYRTPYLLPIFTHNTLILKEKGLLIIDEQPFKNGENLGGGAEGSRTPVQTNPP